MIQPPASVVEYAERLARQSTCAKSKRGAVIFEPRGDAPLIYAVGFNGQPAPFRCSGTERCRELCSRLCEHAEGRAVRLATGLSFALGAMADLVHVKLGEDGRLLAGGPPSCWQCSRAILDCGFISGVWLYEEISSAPVDVDMRVPHTGHVIPVTARDIWRMWRRYTAEEFHRTTLRNCEMEL